MQKNRPKGEKSPNLVTLHATQKFRRRLRSSTKNDALRLFLEACYEQGDQTTSWLKKSPRM
jgi:hypothetical protein